MMSLASVWLKAVERYDTTEIGTRLAQLGGDEMFMMRSDHDDEDDDDDADELAPDDNNDNHDDDH